MNRTIEEVGRHFSKEQAKDGSWHFCMTMLLALSDSTLLDFTLDKKSLYNLIQELQRAELEMNSLVQPNVEKLRGQVNMVLADNEGMTDEKKEIANRIVDRLVQAGVSI